ncbi:MAG: holin [Clostridia bacterium]
MNNFKDNLRNPILISSILSTIFLILSSFNIIHIPDETINTIINSIMSVLVLLGVLTTPSTNDPEKKE